jgi:hypothetical protein
MILGVGILQPNLGLSSGRVRSVSGPIWLNQMKPNSRIQGPIPPKYCLGFYGSRFIWVSVQADGLTRFYKHQYHKKEKLL